MLSVNNPNLSIILPVGCNARCSFCYWEPSCGLTLDRIRFVSETLPDIFQQVSVTGGETTLYKDLGTTLDILRERFPKIVLNTNGFNLTKDIISKCNHINISRHHFLDNENRKVFGTDSVPDISCLKDLCSEGDITLNCVLPDNFSDTNFVSEYIKFAKSVGAHVAFRKYFNNLNVLSDIDKDDTLVYFHGCGACLHRVHEIDGIKVTFKYSVKETHEAIGGIYELILQANGDLTFDWEGKNKLEFEEE